MIAAMIGGGVSGIYAGTTKVAAYAFGTQSFLGLPIYFNSNDNSSIVNVIIAALLSFFVTFILTWILFKDEDQLRPVINGGVEQTVRSSSNEKTKPNLIKIMSPVDGTLLNIEKVNDEVFSKKLTGEGVAVIPSSNSIYSPVSGKILTVFSTKHALGIMSDDGVELLIHVGINTINLNGEHFSSFVEEGSRVEKGSKLLEVDFDSLKEKGYDPTTVIVVTNTSDFTEVIPSEEGSIKSKADTILHIF